MYPGSIFNVIDNSAINQQTVIADAEYRPLFLSVGSFDKGKEGFNRIYGQKFYDMYGKKMSFERHGQNALQTANLINAGAEVLLYRVVAEDSTLANLVLVAKVRKEQIQKTDADGNPLYYDADGNETTTVTENPVMIDIAIVKWESVSISNCKSYDECIAKAKQLFDDVNGVYPLMVFTEIGRGTSVKAIKISPDYATSRGIGMMFYNMYIFEGTEQIDVQTMSFNPNTIYSNKAYGLTKSTSEQICCAQDSDIFDAFIAKVSDIIGIDSSIIAPLDLIFGYTTKGVAIENYIIDNEGVDINADYGIVVAEGDNGSFGDAPVGTSAWANAIKAVYNGEADQRIYDVDTDQVVAVLDANFPTDVKEAIAGLASFRKDFVFFRDMGIENSTWLEIMDVYNEIVTKDRYTSVTATSYDIKDPYTLKNIRVTANYDLATRLVPHFANAPFVPVSGSTNQFTLDSAIEGTVNFVPLITPKVNQKQAIDDLHLNYAIFQQGNCVIQSQYTIQEENTELSFTNNVIAIQEVIRAIRINCPRERFKLVDGYDMTSYAKAVNSILKNFSGQFYEIKFNYTADKLRAMQKIFYATISVKFKQWEQTEIFDIYALGIDD